MTKIVDRLRSISPGLFRLHVSMPAHSGLMVAALGIAIAALGQVVIMSGRAFDLPILTPLADAVFGIFQQPTTILLGVLLLACGGALFAASMGPEREGGDLEGSRPGLRALGGPARRWRWFAGMIVLGVAINAVLWLQLGLGNYESTYPWLWGAGIALVAGAFLYLDMHSDVDLRPRVSLPEVLFLTAVAGVFILLNLRDLTSWYYSVIGDEYTYWEHANAIAGGFSPNFFSLHGVYDVLPRAESYYVAAVMKLFGTDYLGWKFSLVLAGAAVFAPLYFLVRNLFNIPTAVAAVWLLVAGQVMLAYAHAGYDALFPIFPSLLAFALFFSGIRRGSALFIFGAGAAAGMGFYVIYAGRLILPVLLSLFLLYRRHLDFKRDLVILLAGFGLAAAPVVFVDNTDIYTLMKIHSVFNYDPAIVPDPWDRILDNVVRNPLAFNYSTNEQHFISGSLLEPLTAVLSVLGLVVALRRFGRPAFAFLLIWYAIAMAATGIASPHPVVPMIRISYMIPILVVFAAVALGEGYKLLRGAIRNDILRTVGPAVAMAIVLLAVIGSNLYRFWYVTPHNVASTPGAVAMRAVLSAECRQGDRNSIIVAPRTVGGSLGLAITSRDWGGGEPPAIVFHDEMDKVQEFVPTSCTVYMPEVLPLSEADAQRLRQLGGEQTPLYDKAEEQLVIVLK